MKKKASLYHIHLGKGRKDRGREGQVAWPRSQLHTEKREIKLAFLFFLVGENKGKLSAEVRTLLPSCVSHLTPSLLPIYLDLTYLTYLPLPSLPHHTHTIASSHPPSHPPSPSERAIYSHLFSSSDAAYLHPFLQHAIGNMHQIP